METCSSPESSRLSSAEILLAGAIALWAGVILIVNDPGGLSFDPDSYMRLARFRDVYGIFHGGLFLRDNAPYGTVVPWTMPFDGALALAYEIGRAFTDPGRAVYFAARVISPLFAVTIAPLMFFGLRPFFSLRARIVIAGLAATAPQLVAYSLPGDADHHAMIVWLCVLFVLALVRYLFINPPNRRYAAATGIVAAIALWTSPEEFIVISTGLSAVVLHRCLVEMPRAGKTLVHDLVLGGAFALSLTTAWLLDPPYEGLWTLDIDRLSIVYVSFAWLFSATLFGLDAFVWKRAAFSPSRNLVSAALLGAVSFLCWAAIEPDILAGPFGQVDHALLESPLFAANLEMLPMWWLTGWQVPHLVCLILIAIAYSVVIAKTTGRERGLWIACALLMIPVTLLGIRYFRSIYFAEVLGSIPLGLVLAQRTRQYPRYVGYSAVALSIGVMLGAYSATALLWHQLLPSSQEFATKAAAVCSSKGLSEAIAPIENENAIVMAEINFAPMILYLSPQLRTVAAPFIRNTHGILDVLSFFNARTDDEARAVLDKRGVKYVLTCNRGEKWRAGSFGDLIYHETPAWLEQIGSGSAQSGFRLFRVRSGEG